MRPSILAAVASFALLACAAPEGAAPTRGAATATATEAPTPPKPNPGGELPAPVPADVVRTLHAEDAGQTVELAVGQRLAVALVGVPTAGYLWSVDAAPAGLRAVAETGGPTTAAQREPGFVGGQHWEVFTFEATAAGQGTLRLVQRRPWARTDPPSRTFEVTIRVR